MIVGVDDVVALVGVAGEVELPNARLRQAAQESQRIEIMIEGADIDIVDVEQDLAVGALAEFGDELPLREFRHGIGNVARDILQHEPVAEVVLHAPHPLGDVVERFLGVGQGQKIVHVGAAQAGEAEMVGYPHRLYAVDQGLQIGEIGGIERIDRADRHRHTMQRHRIVAADAAEPLKRVAARDHVVLRQRLKPAHLARAGSDLLVMLVAQSQPEIHVEAAHGRKPIRERSGYPDIPDTRE